MQVLIILIVIIGIIYFITKKNKPKHSAPRQVSSRIGTYEKSIEEITGFYGSEEYSPNKEYCVSYCDGYYNNEKWKNGDIALIKGKTLLFKKKIQRPNDCHVSNEGIVICCDWQKSDALTGNFLIFNTSGETIFSKKTSANLGFCAISDNSNIAVFETAGSDTEDSNQIFIIDVYQSKIIQKFDKQSSFNSAFIDTENKIIKLKNFRGFIFELDFNGNQTNKEDYERQVMTNGSIHDKLYLYEQKSDDIKFNDEHYLELLNEALKDKDASYSFGQDSIYRKIGEYFLSSGDINKTIENWEKAIQINPKIGIKRKLEAIKKKI